MSNVARAAWDQRFGTRQVELKSRDPEPFTSLRRLGNGGWGYVDEIRLNGLALALKRTFSPKLTPNAKQELEVLRHVSRKTHRHIVELIGSYVYTEKRRGVYELGIAIWPVACCDLSHFLSEISVLRRWLDGSLTDDYGEDLHSVIETLASLALGHDWLSRNDLYLVSVQRLATCFGCIANAVAWLHDEAHIRHRDLKPAQILLSPNGLWLTDFGLASFIPDLENSATSGVDNVTRKYQAPERALGLRRGRSEDVFGLGCIYLEMTYTLLGLCHETMDQQRTKQGWSYQAHVRQHLHEWLNPVRSQDRADFGQLADLVGTMLAFDIHRRPTMSTVVRQLAGIPASSLKFFDHCCQAAEKFRTYVPNGPTDRDLQTISTGSSSGVLQVHTIKPGTRSSLTSIPPWSMEKRDILYGSYMSITATPSIDHLSRTRNRGGSIDTAMRAHAAIPQPLSHGERLIHGSGTTRSIPRPNTTGSSSFKVIPTPSCLGPDNSAAQNHEFGDSDSSSGGFAPFNEVVDLPFYEDAYEEIEALEKELQRIKLELKVGNVRYDQNSELRSAMRHLQRKRLQQYKPPPRTSRNCPDSQFQPLVAARESIVKEDRSGHTVEDVDLDEDGDCAPLLPKEGPGIGVSDSYISDNNASDHNDLDSGDADDEVSDEDFGLFIATQDLRNRRPREISHKKDSHCKTRTRFKIMASNANQEKDNANKNSELAIIKPPSGKPRMQRRRFDPQIAQTFAAHQPSLQQNQLQRPKEQESSILQSVTVDPVPMQAFTMPRPPTRVLRMVPCSRCGAEFTGRYAARNLSRHITFTCDVMASLRARKTEACDEAFERPGARRAHLDLEYLDGLFKRPTRSNPITY